MKNITFKIKYIIWVLVCLVAIPSSAYCVDGQIKLAQPPSFPMVIDQPGSYVLTCNITVPTVQINCIEIETDNVTLNLNGNTLIGPGEENSSSGNGIYASERNNITITNGTVRNFGGSGIVVTGTNNQIENVKVYANGFYGISAICATITGCTASYNGFHGITASETTINNCMVDSNDFHGISASSATVANCTSSYNGSHGMYISGTTMIGCTSFNNGDRGIYASDSIVASCTANHNDSHGIYASSGCRVEGNNLRHNGGYGIYLSSSGNYAIRNIAGDNGSGNFYGVSNNHMPIDGDNANYGW